MGLVVYKKAFQVDKDFDLAKYIQELDKKNFYPFVLHIEKLSKNKYKFSFQHVKRPLFISNLPKGNIADEILLSESTLELLESAGEIHFAASIRNGTIIVIGFFIVFFTSLPIIMHTSLAWIPLVIFILFHLLKYYWDTKRYQAIGEAAGDFNSLSNNRRNFRKRKSHL